ncbi:MAG: hypothetical protein KBC69_04980 [Candidatus Magasanikbacteria bacterium]|nr:hypothetical protein [Candidatus Magasanikbacteria bacterium]
MLRKTFTLVVGARIQVPQDFAANYNYHGAKNFDPRWANLRPRIARLVFVEDGPDGPLYGFQKKPAEGLKPAPSRILFVPLLTGGETLEIEWVDSNCACARKVSPV